MANTIRIRRRLAAQGAGAPVLTGGNPLRNAELAFNEFSNTLYIGTGGDSTGANAAGAVNAIAGDGAVWTGTATFGTVRATGDVYANTSGATSGKLVATTDYVDSAVSRTTGAGMSLHPVAADCATTGPLNVVSYYDSLAPLISTTVRVAIPQPASAAEGAALYELKGLPIVQTVQLAASDKVLVMGHLDPSMIGLWVIPAGATGSTYWTRETGYETAQGFHFGARVAVASGTYTGQTFAVLADAVYPTKDVAGPNFNSINFATTSSSVPSGAGIQFHKVVRAKADTYTIVNGKVVVDGVTLNQSDRFLWTPQGSAATDGGAASGGYTNVRAGIWRVNYDKVTGGNAFNVITRAGDLNDQADFVNFNAKKILVREGSTNANKIFTAATHASAFTVAQEITDTAGTVATFGTGTTYTAASSGGGLTGTPIIDGYQTVVENLAASPAVIGSVVLVKNEVNPVNNGLYYVKTGGWIRHPSADAAGELFYGSYIRVNNGTVNRNSGFVLTTNLETITPGTDALSFESPTALLDFRAGVGLERVGREFRVKAASAVVTVASGGVDVRAGTTSLSGVVQLSDSTSTTSSVLAATPTAVKAAYDAAAAAQTTANTGVANAATAQTTANTGVANAATAQTTANTGVANAATAQTTANTGVANAATAQTTADGALSRSGGGTMTGTITLRAGTATAGQAPIYLQSGTNLGVVAAGAVEYNGTNLYFTGVTGNGRKQVILGDSTSGYSVGELLYGSGTGDTFAKLAKPSAAAVLFNDNAGTPSWNAVTGTGNVVRADQPTFTGSIATSSTTIGVFDATATTVNAFGGASTALNMGNASGTTLIRGDLTLGAAASGKKLKLNGATSGTVDIQAAAAAGTNTATFPAATGNVILDTTGGLTSSTLAGMLSDETGTGVAVFATSPTFTTSVVNAAASATFNVFNGAVTNLNAFAAAANVNIASDNSFTSALAINIGNNLPASGQVRTINIGTAGANTSTSNIVIGAPPTNGTSTTTLNGTVVVAGNLTVNGATTILNTNTLSVDDKNIEIGSVVASTPTCTVAAGSSVVSGMSSVANIVVGATFALTSGAAGVTVPVGTKVLSVDSPTSILLDFQLGGSGSAVGATASIGGATDVTAAGGGITLKGDTNKTIIWNDATKGWEFNQNVTTSGATVNVNGANPTIATTQTSGTATVFGGNFAGTVAVGNSGATTIVSVPSTKTSTATTNGALVVGGGVGIAGAVYAGGDISTSGNLATTGVSSTATISGSTVNINGNNPAIVTTATGTASVFNTNALTGNLFGACTAVTVGGASTTTLTLGTATAASTTNIATGINPTTVVKTVNVGTAGAAGSTTSVNIGSGTASAITNVSVGGTHTAGGVTINPTTTATSTSTGALIVAGGVGIAENLHVGGNVTISTGKALNRSLATTLTAAGANQATALALTNDINIVTTTASGTGVVLPTPTVGRVVVVINRGASALNVYPAVGHSINGTANSAVVLAINATMIVRGATVTTWFSELTDLTNAATGTLPIGNGGTGATSAANAFNALSPNTTLGDLIYGNGANTNTRLAGNTTTTRQVLTQTGTGSASAAPAWVDQCSIVADCTLDGGTF